MLYISNICYRSAKSNVEIALFTTIGMELDEFDCW